MQQTIVTLVIMSGLHISPVAREAMLPYRRSKNRWCGAISGVGNGNGQLKYHWHGLETANEECRGKYEDDALYFNLQACKSKL